MRLTLFALSLTACALGGVHLPSPFPASKLQCAEPCDSYDGGPPPWCREACGPGGGGSIVQPDGGGHG